MKKIYYLMSISSYVGDGELVRMGTDLPKLTDEFNKLKLDHADAEEELKKENETVCKESEKGCEYSIVQEGDSPLVEYKKFGYEGNDKGVLRDYWIDNPFNSVFYRIVLGFKEIEA